MDDYGHGREEQLSETLAAIERKETFDDACRARLDRVPHNRAKKHRRMRQHLSAVRTDVTVQSNPSESFETRELVRSVRRVLTGEQWAIEFRLALGESYSKLSREYEVSPAALKVRVCRWRVQVRERLALS